MFERSNSASLRASMRSLLLPSLSRAFRRGLHTTSSVTCGLIRSYDQAAQVPSSKVTCRLPRRPLRKSRMVMALVSIVDSMTSLPEEFSTAIEIASLCTSIPIYFTLSIEGAPFCCGFDANTQNPTPKGAPFYIASRNRKSTALELHLHDKSVNQELVAALRKPRRQRLIRKVRFHCGFTCCFCHSSTNRSASRICSGVMRALAFERFGFESKPDSLNHL